MSNKRGLLVVITAPSGSGKTSIYKRLLQIRDDMKFSVSYTTRKQRKGEINGIDYFFILRDEFEEKIKKGDFLEWAEVHGELYGTEKSQVEKCIKDGYICLLDIDVQGAMQVMKKFCKDDLVTIFIEPPSIEELARRLHSRGTETEESIKIRLNNALNELEYKNQFRYIVTNDNLERAVREISKIIDLEKSRRE